MQATEPDPREIIRGWGALTTEVAPRTAPILLLVRAAATADPEMARLQSQLNAQRHERMIHNARSVDLSARQLNTIANFRLCSA
jgi:hypothetical protein